MTHMVRILIIVAFVTLFFGGNTQATFEMVKNSSQDNAFYQIWWNVGNTDYFNGFLYSYTVLVSPSPGVSILDGSVDLCGAVKFVGGVSVLFLHKQLHSILSSIVYVFAGQTRGDAAVLLAMQFDIFAEIQFCQSELMPLLFQPLLPR
jgi:hypothetical protein